MTYKINYSLEWALRWNLATISLKELEMAPIKSALSSKLTWETFDVEKENRKILWLTKGYPIFSEGDPYPIFYDIKKGPFDTIRLTNPATMW